MATARRVHRTVRVQIVERMLVYKRDEADNYHDGTQTLAENWVKHQQGRRWFWIKAPKKPTGTVFVRQETDGWQHLRAIGSMARLGAEAGKSQHLHMWTHGDISGVDEAGNPTNAGITLGSNQNHSLEVSLRLLTSNHSDDAEQKARVERALADLKLEFEKASVSELSIHGCMIGRSQAFLDLLGVLLGVQVHAPSGYSHVRITFDTKLDEEGAVAEETNHHARHGVSEATPNPSGSWGDSGTIHFNPNLDEPSVRNGGVVPDGHSNVSSKSAN